MLPPLKKIRLSRKLFLFYLLKILFICYLNMNMVSKPIFHKSYQFANKNESPIFFLNSLLFQVHSWEPLSQAIC